MFIKSTPSKMKRYIILLLCLLYFKLMNCEPLEQRRCKEYKKNGARTTVSSDYDASNEDDAAELERPFLNETGVVLCIKQYQFCYSVFMVNTTGVYLERQGCWDVNDNKQREQCNSSQCISSPQSSPHPRVKFCCCSTDLCNENITMAYVDSGSAESVIQTSASTPPYVETISLWEVSAFYAFFVILGIVIFFSMTYIWCTQSSKQMPELSPLAPSGPGYSSNSYNVDNLNVVAIIGQGRYGSVWKGIVNEQSVAVKIFSYQNKQYFYNEKDIYSLPFMDNPSLLTYFGCDERHTLDGSIEYLLILSLAPLGSLQSYLISNTISFDIFCKMAKSIAKGLAHLHAEVKQDGLVKPCVCHRDLNSCNILVKSDLSCCICDFGFAMKTYGSKYDFMGELVSAETKSINEVGTIRYMAPEMLEGAMNLRDCESALKQIDVYSLGLILWELCVRCHDWYPVEVPMSPYKAPYEAEIGKHPSFEQMQILVSKRKARPLFPPTWVGGMATKFARETCEDCWDHDAEARLTSRCVEERISELSHMRIRGNNNLSPTINTNNLAAPTTPSFMTTSPNARENVSLLAEIPTASSTIKNKEMYAIQIHPYQGIKPCLERNLAPLNQNSSNSGTETLYVEKSCKDEHEVLVHDIIKSRSLITSMGEGFPKQNNTEHRFKGWPNVKAILERKLFKVSNNSIDEKSNLVETTGNVEGKSSPAKNVIVNLKTENGLVSSVIHEKPKSHLYKQRPRNLDLAPMNISFRTQSEVFRSLPSENKNQKFAVIQQHASPKLVVSRSANAMKSLATSSTCLDQANNISQLKRQRSLEIYKEVFGPSKESLRDPSQRIKTPGDVPKSVREKRVRASKTLSLYDDRMMNSGNYL